MNILIVSIKKKLYKVRTFVFLWPNYFYDMHRYVKYSLMGGHPRNKIQYHALINRDYHKLEKSLSFDKFKPYSGKDTVSKILANIRLFSHKYGFEVPVRNAVHTLREYVNFHNKIDCRDDYIEKLDKEVSDLENELQMRDWQDGGVKQLSKKQLTAHVGTMNPEDFFLSRYSIRNYSSEPVAKELIEQAFSLALKTPSVCNRQGWKGYLVSNKPLIASLLKIQGGSRGFDHSISNLLIVVGDLNHFSGSGERNQVYVDGGMFAMSLVYALHSVGLGSCCLNWAADFTKDIALRKVFKLRKYETVIMMIAVGHYPEEVTVCQSPRKFLKEVLEVF